MVRRPEPTASGPIRQVLLSAAVVLALGCVLVGTIAQPVAARPPAGSTAAYYKECGHPQTFIGVLAHDLACHKALAVARLYLTDNNNRPLGFYCKRVNVNAAAGYYTHCTKRPTAVNIVPE